MELEKAILTELEKQIIAPERIVKLRLFLYPQGLNREYLWSNTHYQIKNLINERQLVKHHGWLLTKNTLDNNESEVIDKIYQDKKIIYDQWNKAAIKGGYHHKKLVKEYLEEQGIKACTKTVTWKNRRVRIDLWYPGVATKIKNVLSDAYVNPNNIHGNNAGHVQLVRLFEMSKDLMMKPVLIAPLIDDSFYKFIEPYNGLFCRTFTQLLESQWELLTCEIDRAFNISSNNILATDQLPNSIKQWINNNLL